ncbi:helix-turn-helix domain-containing protein [Labilibaculum antarcticum]|uniref:Helix-turn-helix domain-containing protein n=1 Tax=Labilibaculum antarcticum TaxID=1717717 RepID=A0A1Y1CP61_9BACT|nr:helix-turn-helix domain-containing protein [Labilibaculum antarcticum]BAX81742.1 helix-turn-helix domain-containing protein [Labilibaculum antarcticum]
MIYEKDQKAIENALKRICSHPLFANSSIYTRLLEYLVEKALSGEELKEFTIGTDLFGKNYLDDKNDGTVRSYMYKLRKKLAAYYAEADIRESVIFEIKKGQYNLSFIPSNKYHQLKKNTDISIKIPLKALKLAGIIAFTVLAASLVIINQMNTPSNIWKAFFEKMATNMVIVSDQYIVDEIYSDGEMHGVAYPEINNADDFFTYTQKHPEKHLKPNDYTLLSKMAPYSVKRLTQWFDSNKTDYTLQLESELSYDDVRENNIVFVGQFKTMNLSKSLFLKNSKAFTTYLDGFKYETKDTVKVFDTKYGENGKIEYAMVSYTSISPSKKAIYFVSNNDIGVMATLRKFTDKKWLSKFCDGLTKDTNHFNALFEVSGLQRTDISCKLIELEIIE